MNRSDFDTPGDALPRPHPNCYWLLPGRILCGEHPSRGGPHGMAALAAVGVTHFVDLTSEHDRLPSYSPLGGQRLSHPIADFGVPTSQGMRATLTAAEHALQLGGVIYLHCKAGIGRTGTVAACLLVEHGFTPEEALALLQRKWTVAGQRAYASHTPETPAQHAFIAGWSAA
jgi:atypical dual specificity phosphatase